MSYREKMAWLSLIAMVVTFGPYFAMAAAEIAATALPNWRQLGLYGVAAVVRLVILGVGTLVLRRGAPEEARSPLDERDKAILYQARSAAYFVMMAGMILVGVIMPFTDSGWRIVNSALFMIVAAEVVHYGLVVFGYRRHS